MIETNAVALRKSLETSTRSTVIPDTRGSATSKRIAVETTSRIASAIRRPRWEGISVSNLGNGVAQDLCARVCGDSVRNPFQRFSGLTPGLSHGGGQ